jgi:two-component system NtrC family sensor kinase
MKRLEMSTPSPRQVAILAFVAILVAFGARNLHLKATWGFMDDGVLWQDTPRGPVANELSETGPGRRAGLERGDRLLAIDGRAVASADEAAGQITSRRPEEQVLYLIERGAERRALPISIRWKRPTRLSLYYYLAAVGFLSLMVGTIVLWRRPQDRLALHLFALSTLFYLSYTFSFTGKLDALDWAFFWIDNLATLFLPVVFLHFCLVFPERRDPSRRARIVPVLYTLPAAVALVGAASQWLFLEGGPPRTLWAVLSSIDRAKPFYFALLFGIAFAVLLGGYRATHRPTVRKQVKWLVWGTGAGVFPFLVFYAVPFALGGAGQSLELVGYLPLALIPLSLAYAITRHRLMEIEVALRRGLVTLLATLALVGASLLAVLVVEAVLRGDETLHTPVIALLCTLVVLFLFAPVKHRIQDAVERLSYRERYVSRKALLHLSQEINADLDLMRISERLVTRLAAALGVDAAAVLLPDDGETGAFAIHHALSRPRADARLALPQDAAALELLADGRVVSAESGAEGTLGALGLAYLFPCRVGGALIAVLGVGRVGMDPLNSEETDLVQALSGQVATALVNARLYRTLAEKAFQLARLTEYNESILECLGAGIVVLDLEGLAMRWNRAMETLTGRPRSEVLGRPLDQILPQSFLETVSDSLLLGEREEINHVYKARLDAVGGGARIVDVAVAPFQTEPGRRAGTILIVEDVTTRMRLEEQLLHADKMASIGLLAAGVAHEVNTPLAGISSYAQMLRDQIEAADPRARLLEKIERQSFRAAKIIGSLLNFSRSGSLDTAPVDLNRVILDVLALSEHQLASVRVKVRKELADDLPPVHGSASRLQQVFFNLVSNARDAMPTGGWMTLASWTEGQTVVAEVRDTGDGIPREHLVRIFDPFFTTKGVGRGTGLGLSVAYGIVQDHRGSITVESLPRKGTTFRVTLPAMPAQSIAQQG